MVNEEVKESVRFWLKVYLGEEEVGDEMWWKMDSEMWRLRSFVGIEVWDELMEELG